MFKNKNTALLNQLGVVLGGLVLFCVVLGSLSIYTLQLHYASEQLRSEIINLRNDPLLKKHSENFIPPEPLDLDDLRELAGTQRLELVGSRSGENSLEISLRGGYSSFLDFLRCLSLEYIGEISQLELNTAGQVLEGKIVIKQGTVNEK